MNPEEFGTRARLRQAAALAAAMLDARPDPTLAAVARNASVVANSRDRDQCALAFEYRSGGETKTISWPAVGFFTAESAALPLERIAENFVAVLDDLAARENVEG